MLVLLCILSFIIKDIIAGDASVSDWIDILIRQLKHQWLTYQIVIFKNDSNTRSLEENFVFKALITQLPIAIVNLSKTNAKYPLFVSRSTTIYIMLQLLMKPEDVYIEEAKNNLNFIIRLSSPKSRPRCLMIFLNSLKSEKSIQTILLHAWSIKFLDFSIISIDPKNLINVFSYNPFTATYKIEHYTSQVNLFPQKMANMNGYKVKLPYIDSQPYVVQKSDSSYSGTDYDIIKLVAEILNFKPVFLNYESGYAALQHAVHDLEDGYINLLPFTLFTSHPLTLYNTKVEHGVVFTFDSFCELVPLSLSSKKINISFKILIYLFVGIIIILAAVLVTDHLGITRQMKNPFSIVQLFFGTSGVRQPKRTADRIMFFCVVILSMTFCGHIYAKVTESHLTEISVRLASFSDIEKSNLIPYASEGIYTWIFNDPRDKSLEVIKSRTQIKEVKTCIRYILEGKQVICFVFKSKGIMYMQRYTKPDGSTQIRRAEFEFMFNGKNFVFEQASPYVEKFNKVIEKIVESGIIELWSREKKVRKRSPLEDENFWDNKNNSLLLLQIGVILAFGYAVSTIVFVLELMYYHLKWFKLQHCF